MFFYCFFLGGGGEVVIIFYLNKPLQDHSDFRKMKEYEIELIISESTRREIIVD